MDRVAATNGVVFYRSMLLLELGVRHAFSTRIGGVSTGPFSSLNLGNPGGCPTPDTNAAIEANYRRLQEAAGLPHARVAVDQVHGGAVASLAGGRPTLAQADALVSADAAMSVAIRTADCAAVLIASRDARVIAAVHAGWRGVVADVIPAALAAMRAAGAVPFAAALFPSISRAHFEVGCEVVAAFRARGLPAQETGGAKGWADVAGACAAQLQAGGVTHLDRSASCTFADAAEFFSYRRDGVLTGRMALLAVAAPAA